MTTSDDQVPSEPTISVKSIKKRLGVREKPKDKKQEKTESAPSLKLQEGEMK
jgi:hypothetical protein